MVKRLHCLVHELQGWLGSFHGGGGGGDSNDSDTSPEAALLLPPLTLPHCLGRSRSQTGAISSFLAVTRERGVPRGSCPRGNSGKAVSGSWLLFVLVLLEPRLWSPDAGSWLLTSRLALRGLSPHDTNHAANLSRAYRTGSSRPDTFSHFRLVHYKLPPSRHASSCFPPPPGSDPAGPGELKEWAMRYLPRALMS